MGTSHEMIGNFPV